MQSGFFPYPTRKTPEIISNLMLANYFSAKSRPIKQKNKDKHTQLESITTTDFALLKQSITTSVRETLRISTGNFPD